MAVFVAMEPPDGNAEGTILVRDGFRFWAFLLPFAWFLAHRMWLEALMAFLAALAISLVAGLPPLVEGATFLSLLFQLAIGLEAGNLRRWHLDRRGWTERAAVEAGSMEEAETRYFADMPEPPAPVPAPLPWGRGPALDLFDHRRPA